MRRLMFVVAAAVLVSTAIALALSRPAGGRPSSARAAGIDPHVAMGAHIFVQFACSACHGEQGSGTVSRYVPALKSIGKALTVAQLTSIIKHGLGEARNPQAAVHASLGPGHLEEPGRRISSPTFAPACPRCPTRRLSRCLADQGQAVAGECSVHPLRLHQLPRAERLGGVPNPQSPDKAIPRSRVRISGRSSTPTPRSSTHS